MALVLGACAAEPSPPDDVVWLAEDGAVWCYRTLADVDCLARPEPGAEHRLVAIGPRRSFVPAEARPGARSQPQPAAAHGDGPLRLVAPTGDG